MSPQDKVDFFCDIREIDIQNEYKSMFYGVQRYILKIDIPLPETGFRQLCQKNQFKFMHDFQYALQRTRFVQNQSMDKIFADLLNPAKFKTFVSKVFMTVQHGQNNPSLISGLFP